MSYWSFTSLVQFLILATPMGEFVFNECIRSHDNRTTDTRQELFESDNVINSYSFCN